MEKTMKGKVSKSTEDNIQSEIELRDMRSAQLNRLRLQSLGLSEESDLKRGFSEVQSNVNACLIGRNLLAAKINTHTAIHTVNDYSTLNTAMKASMGTKIDILSEISGDKFRDNMNILAKDMGYDHFKINLENNMMNNSIVAVKNNGGKVQLVSHDLDSLKFNADGFGLTNAKDYFQSFVDSKYANELTAIKNTKNVSNFVSQNDVLKKLNLGNMTSAQINNNLSLYKKGKGVFANAEMGTKLSQHHIQMIEEIGKVKAVSEKVERAKALSKNAKGTALSKVKKATSNADVVNGYQRLATGKNILSKTITTPQKLAEAHRLKQRSFLEKKMSSKKEDVRNKATKKFEKLYGKEGKHTLRENKRIAKQRKSRKYRKAEAKKFKKANKKLLKVSRSKGILSKGRLSLRGKLLKFSKSCIRALFALIKWIGMAIGSFLLLFAQIIFPILGILSLPIIALTLFAGPAQEEIDIANNLASSSLERQLYVDIKNWNPDLSDIDIAGIMGNIAYDSDFMPFQSIEDNETGEIYRGLCSWTENEQDWITSHSSAITRKESNIDENGAAIYPDDLGDPFDATNEYALKIQLNRIGSFCMKINDSFLGKNYNSPSEAAKAYAGWVGTTDSTNRRYVTTSSIPVRQKKAEEEYRLIQGWNLMQMLNPEPQCEPSINFLQYPFAFLQATFRNPENPEYFDGFDFNYTSANDWNVQFVAYCLNKSKIANVYNIDTYSMTTPQKIREIAMQEGHWIPGNSISDNPNIEERAYGNTDNTSRYDQLKPGYILVFHDENELYPEKERWKIGIFVDFYDDPTYGRCLYVIEGDSYGDSNPLEKQAGYEAMGLGFGIHVSSAQHNVVGHIYYLAYEKRGSEYKEIVPIKDYTDPESNDISTMYHLVGAYAWYNDTRHGYDPNVN